jgi:hypothetical protein
MGRTCYLIPVTACLLGISLVGLGWTSYRSDLSWLVAILGQAGTPNPRILEKLLLVPPLLVATGTELLLLGGAGFVFRRRWISVSGDCVSTAPILQRIVWLLLVGYSLVVLLTLNFGGLSFVNRFRSFHHRTRAEIIAADFAEDYPVVRALREQTPHSAAILIKTRRPLQYLLSYELYPRRFYFYPDREMPSALIPQDWLDRHQIGWILEISNDGPLQFLLLQRKVSF